MFLLTSKNCSRSSSGGGTRGVNNKILALAFCRFFKQHLNHQLVSECNLSILSLKTIHNSQPTSPAGHFVSQTSRDKQFTLLLNSH